MEYIPVIIDTAHIWFPWLVTTCSAIAAVTKNEWDNKIMAYVRFVRIHRRC